MSRASQKIRGGAKTLQVMGGDSSNINILIIIGAV